MLLLDLKNELTCYLKNVFSYLTDFNLDAQIMFPKSVYRCHNRPDIPPDDIYIFLIFG